MFTSCLLVWEDWHIKKVATKTNKPETKLTETKMSLRLLPSASQGTWKKKVGTESNYVMIYNIATYLVVALSFYLWSKQPLSHVHVPQTMGESEMTQSNFNKVTIVLKLEKAPKVGYRRTAWTKNPNIRMCSLYIFNDAKAKQGGMMKNTIHLKHDNEVRWKYSKSKSVMLCKCISL